MVRILTRRIVLPRPPTPPLPRVADSPVFSAAGSVWALLFGVGMLLLGNGLQGTLLGVRAAEEAFGSTVTGMIMSGYFVGFLLGSRIAPRTIRRVGHLRVFAAIASLASIAILVQSVLVTPTVWMLMRVLTGYCLASAYIVAESWLNDRVTNEHRGGLLAVYMIVSYAGMGGGQLLLNTGSPMDHSLFILVSVLISFAAIPILFSITPQPLQDNAESLGVRALYRISPLGMVGSFGSGILQGAVFGMGAVYARGAGLTLQQVSIFMFVLIAGAAVLQWPVGKLSDRIDRRKVIAGLALFGTAASLVAIVATWMGPRLLVALAVFIGAGPMLLYSLFIAYTNDYLRAEQMVAASSTMILGLRPGRDPGPVGQWRAHGSGRARGLPRRPRRRPGRDRRVRRAPHGAARARAGRGAVAVRRLRGPHGGAVAGAGRVGGRARGRPCGSGQRCRGGHGRGGRRVAAGPGVKRTRQRPRPTEPARLPGSAAAAVAPHHLERLAADVVLDALGVDARHGLADAERQQEVEHDGVALARALPPSRGPRLSGGWDDRAR
ncbi:MAG: MFS transporter [Halofilum sp. (in: g-proteobacteria)]|nr:MFS transporter [Halofilum sp. (in: g-proteobacteria)]